MIANDKLRGIVYGKFKTEKDFADALGWTKQHLNKALKNPGRLRLDQANHILKTLGLDDKSLCDIFLI